MKYKPCWAFLFWFTVGAILLFPLVGFKGIAGVLFIAIGARDSHEHFCHKAKDDER